MSWQKTTIIAALIVAAGLGGALWPRADRIELRQDGQPIVVHQRGGEVRMCWPEVAKPDLLTDAQFLGGEPAPETVEMRCTGWR